jgi:hypothetical protein
MRRDVRVPNESDAFLFTSAGLRGRGLMPGDAPWMASVGLARSCPCSSRAKTPRTSASSSAARCPRRKIASGSAGSRADFVFPTAASHCVEAAYVIDQGGWAEEYARVIEIPPGNYRASLYSYASAPNGRRCLEQAGRTEPLGAWFRRTRPGQDMPTWLHSQCVHDPSLDPDKRKHWTRAAEKDGGQVIDFLLHLEPCVDLTPVATEDHGFAEARDCRAPEPFPLGLPVDDPDGLDEESIEESDHEASAAPDPPAEVTDVRSRTERYPLAPIAGGPVDVPVARIVRVARLAWMCHPYTQPALRITFPGAAPHLVDDVEGVEVRREGRELRIGFENTGQPAGAQDAVVAVGKQLRELPDGCTIELETARLGRSEGARPPGVLRFSGRVTAATWGLDAAFPPIDADRLKEALSVAEALETPRRFVARDEAEAELIEQRVTTHAPEFFVANPLTRTGRELAVQRRDPAALWQIAVRACWLRYAGVLPLRDFDREPFD